MDVIKVIAFFLRSGHKFFLHITLLVLLITGAKVWAQDTPPTKAPVYPTDWVVNGQHLHHVKVLEVGADFVSVSHDDGGGEIPLSSLTPDLQKLFNYPHPLAEGMTPHGLHFKDLVEGSGDPIKPGDVITFSLTGKSAVTLDALKDVATALQAELQTQKTTVDAALTAARAKYDAAVASNNSEDQAKATSELQTIQKQVDDLGVQISALQSNSYTITFGQKELLPNLNEVLAGMKAGGKRAVIPPATPTVTPAPSSLITLGLGKVSPTPTPVPTPTPAPTAPPLAYEIDVMEIAHPDAP